MTGSRLGKLGLVLGATVAGLVLAEVALRLLAPRPSEAGEAAGAGSGYLLWPPEVSYAFEPDGEAMPGIEGTSIFRSNALGLRADPLEPRHDLRILAIGGSTTACIYLDQTEMWTHLLQEALDRDGAGRVWVGNAGKDGLSTRDHRLQAEHILPLVRELDAVLLLVGVNDLLVRLSKDEAYDPHFMERPDAAATLAPRVFAIRPEAATADASRGDAPGADGEQGAAATPGDGEQSATASQDDGERGATAAPGDGAGDRPPGAPAPAWWERLRVVQLVHTPRVDLPPDLHRVNDVQGGVHDTRRAVRQAAERFLDELPDLTSALDEFRRNLEHLVDQVQAVDAVPVLITQPSLWHDDLPPELEALVWMAGKGDFLHRRVKTYYTVSAMARGMAAYNAVTREVAAERGVPLIDLVPHLPRDTTSYYDDVHYNESGARRVAQVLTASLESLGLTLR